MGLSNSSHSFHAKTKPAPSMAPSTAPSCLNLHENDLFNSVFDNEAFDMRAELPPEVLVSVEREGSVTVQLAASSSISGRPLDKSASKAEEEEIEERDESISGISFVSCQEFFEPASSDHQQPDLHEDRVSPWPASFHSADSGGHDFMLAVRAEEEINLELLRLLTLR
jgi:hypothetical protein